MSKENCLHLNTVIKGHEEVHFGTCPECEKMVPMYTVIVNLLRELLKHSLSQRSKK